MTLSVVDGNGVPTSLASDFVSNVHTPHHKVTSLPGTTQADIADSKSLLATLASAVSGSRYAVDLTTAVTGYLQTLASTVTTQRVAVDLGATLAGYLQSLASAVSGARIAVDLPATPTANLATLASAVSGSRYAVDLTTAVTGYLQTLAGAVASARVAVDLATTPTANLATLAGAITSSKMQADVVTLPTPNSVGPFVTRSTVSTGATQLGSQACKHGVWLRNLHTSQTLAFGNGSGLTIGNGYLLYPREEKFIPAANQSQIWIVGSASSTDYSASAS